MIKSMLYRVSLLQSLVVMIVISLLLPLPILLLTYVNSTYKNKQDALTALYTKKFNLSSTIFSESLWNYYPELGQKMLDQLLLDKNVQFVHVKDNEGQLFLGWDAKDTRADNTLFLHTTLEKDDVTIGSLEMGFKREDLLESMMRDMTLFGSILALQVIFLIGVISLVYYYKILKPIKRLVFHSQLLAQQKLGEPFEWDENDEIGTLGHVLNQTRIKLKNLFDTLREENESLDEKVKQRTQELEDASRYKSEFLANMSHEIRTPMNAIMGMSHLLGKTAMNTTQQSYVSKIKEASSLLLRIINDILDFSKIEAGKMDVETIAFDLHKELKKSCSIFSVLAKEKGVDFQCDFVETNRFFKGDPCKIMQIVNNFLSNAIKFTQEGAIVLSVYEEVMDEKHSKVILSVKDSGIGIAKEKQSFLFQAFGQVDASITRKHGGTGLGLYICSQLAHMLNATIFFESEENRGSLFSLNIVLEIAKGVDLQHENAVEAFEPLHILLVEDQKKVSDVLCEFIRSFGFFITIAKSRDDIASIIQEDAKGFHLLMIDYELSHKKNGLDFYTALKQKIPANVLPLAMMIATNDDGELKERIYNAGIKSFLKKPINASMLYDELVAICSISAHVPLFDPSKIDLSQKRILVVEDNDINLEVATYLLKETHAKVEVARNGLEAVEILQEVEYPFDLILMDVQMPLMDGYEATRIIRKELNVLTPIVAMTANVMIQDIEKCLAAGMDAHIGKPFEVEDFYGTLLEALHVSVSMSPKQHIIAQKPLKQRFNKQEAIKRLGGNEELWQKLFRSFYESYAGLPYQLQTLKATKDKEALIAYVHTQKGLCGTIGLFALEEALAQAESFLKTHEHIEKFDINAILTVHKECEGSLQKELSKIASIPIHVQHDVLSSSLDIVSLLQALYEALEISNVTKIHTLLEQLASHESLRDNPSFKSLVLTCKTFDFEKALEHLKYLLEEMKHG